MATARPRNDRENGVTKFCRSLEEHRRTEVGRVKTAREFLDNFFPHNPKSSEDRVFKTIPREVRGPIISGWGIRGEKSAVKDDDERTRNVVHDALLAGDVDENMFEAGLTSDILIDWIALSDWWSFWRSGKIVGAPVQRALALARELGLFDDRWFLEHVKGRGGRLAGTDIVCDTLPKDQIIAWIRNVHGGGDGSPAGLVSALGWDVILAKTSQEALLHALDQLAQKIGLVAAAGGDEEISVSLQPAKTAVAPSVPAGALPQRPSGEVAIPDFGVSEMPPVAETDSEWPADPFPPAPRAAYGLGDAEEEPTNQQPLPKKS
jgi:hypothetical protein